MNQGVAATVFGLIFLAELPDKTMFASLVLASRGRPFSVWTGVAAAFAVHVVIAVSIGTTLFEIVPHTLLELFVAVGFLAGAGYSFIIRDQGSEEVEGRTAGTSLRTVVGAAGVIFVAEWGDLTQIVTANLAARYHSALSVGAGAVAALWIVAAVAVAGGTGLLKLVSVRTLRTATALVLGVLGAYTLAGVIAAL